MDEIANGVYSRRKPMLKTKMMSAMGAFGVLRLFDGVADNSEVVSAFRLAIVSGSPWMSI